MGSILCFTFSVFNVDAACRTCRPRRNPTHGERVAVHRKGLAENLFSTAQATEHHLLLSHGCNDVDVEPFRNDDGCMTHDYAVNPVRFFVVRAFEQVKFVAGHFPITGVWHTSNDHDKYRFAT